MNKKVLAFIFDGKRFLALRNNSKDTSHGGDKWFTVTGSLEGDESFEEGVRREVKEEIGADVVEIFNLNWGSVYKRGEDEFKEMNFIAFVNSDKLALKEEHSKYEWLNLDDFIKKIDWEDNKELLKLVLTKGINREVYFDKKERGQ